MVAIQEIAYCDYPEFGNNAINKYGGYIGQYTGNYKYKPNKKEVKTVRTGASTGTTDISNMLFLGFNGLKIAKVLIKYGVYIQLGREEEFINNIYKKSDEEARKELIKEWQEVNLFVHKEFDINQGEHIPRTKSITRLHIEQYGASFIQKKIPK